MFHKGQVVLTWNEERILSGRGLVGEHSLVNAVLKRESRLEGRDSGKQRHTMTRGTATPKEYLNI